MANFDTAIARVLKNEGGYSNRNPTVDPGGETYRGIARRFHPEWGGWPHVDALKTDPAFPAVLDANQALQDSVVAFYRENFWARVNADSMPPALAFQALDFAVNSGVETAVRKLQAAAGVADDGHWGPVTQAAVAAMPPAKLGARFLAQRARFWASLSNWPQNSRGWTERLAADLEYLAQDL